MKASLLDGIVSHVINVSCIANKTGEGRGRKGFMDQLSGYLYPKISYMHSFTTFVLKYCFAYHTL